MWTEDPPTHPSSGLHSPAGGRVSPARLTRSAPPPGEFMESLRDPDLNVRRATLAFFNSAVHNKPSLVRDLLGDILPLLYQETKVRRDLIREVSRRGGPATPRASPTRNRECSTIQNVLGPDRTPHLENPV